MAETPHDVNLAPNFSIQVTKLLDIPVPAAGAFSSRNQVYVIHVYDEEMHKILGTSDKINGKVEADFDSDCHTLLLANEGIVKVNSSGRLFHIELEREGILGNEVIGQCRISRLDPRSPSQHRYALTHDEYGAHCGIELQVLEPKFNPKANVHKDPNSLPEHQRQTMHAPIINNGYVAMFVVDKVSDLPAPPKGLKPEIFLSFEADEKDYEDHELQRSGPFKVEPAPHNAKLRSSFVRQTTGVRAPLRVGGASGEGAMYLRVQVAYVSSHGQMEVVGLTDAIQVRVMESPMQYYEIKPRTIGTPLGGIHLKHRLVTEDTWKKIERELGSGSALPQHTQGQKKQEHYVDTTKPGGNVQMKQQLQNLEAQNRADYQRYKSHLPAGKVPGESYEGGYRVWSSMSAMFESMGPHPLAGGDSVGPRVVRGYEEDKKDFDNLQRALRERTSKSAPKPRKGLNQSKAIPGKEEIDPFLDPAVARLMYDGDPEEVTHRLRPNICKDPEEISRERNIEWLQNSKYVPIRNMSAEDRETLRLSQYTKDQDAKMNYYDVVPHYKINEDIWGVAAEAKAVKASLMRPPGDSKRRVKDECIMA